MRILMLVLPLLSLHGCREIDEGTVSTRQASGRAVAIPASDPGIRGVITAKDSSSVQVEANPTEESGSPKAVLRLTPETAVVYRLGERGDLEDLTVGHNVSVWFEGPVAESYPLQGTAAIIVIDPAGISGRPCFLVNSMANR